MTGEHADRYREAGVDYEVLDRAKRTALGAAAQSAQHAIGRGAVVLERSRGEPAVLIELGGLRLGFVLECLGTKSLIAAAYENESGVDCFDAIGYDTVASAVNDCLCVGALPVVANAYFATGSVAFYEGTRADSLVSGFAAGCADSGAEWGGGESPTLSGLVYPDAIDLACSVVGVVPEQIAPILGEELAPGDEIVLVFSSGLHQNGASLVRALVGELDEGLFTQLSSGERLGEALLVKSVIYASLIERLFVEQVSLHYVSHITGHGLRKIMRADRALCYRVTALPPVPEVLSFLVGALEMSDREAYATFNMGAGMALYVPPGEGMRVVEVARALGYGALVAGTVEAGARSVVIEPLGLTYDSAELDLR